MILIMYLHHNDKSEEWHEDNIEAGDEETNEVNNSKEDSPYNIKGSKKQRPQDRETLKIA